MVSPNSTEMNVCTNINISRFGLYTETNIYATIIGSYWANKFIWPLIDINFHIAQNEKPHTQAHEMRFSSKYVCFCPFSSTHSFTRVKSLHTHTHTQHSESDEERNTNIFGAQAVEMQTKIRYKNNEDIRMRSNEAKSCTFRRRGDTQEIETACFLPLPLLRTYIHHTNSRMLWLWDDQRCCECIRSQMLQYWSFECK